MFFFVEKIAIRRYESNMHLDVGKNLANSKNWKVSRPNAACVHSIWNNEHVFLSGYAKRAAGWKGKSGLLYHLGLTEKKTGQLRISMISSFSSSSGCWSVHLFQHFPSLLWLWAISFHQINFNIFVHIFFKLSSISLHLTEMKIEVSLLLRGR